MRNRTQKLVWGILKTLGISAGVLVTIILIVVSALLYYESHDFADPNGLDKKEFSCYRSDLWTVPSPADRERKALSENKDSVRGLAPKCKRGQAEFARNKCLKTFF